MNKLYFSLTILAVISTSVCHPRIQKRDVQDDAYWNDAVGTLLQNITAEILEAEGNYFQVDDFADTFGGKLLDGKLKATGGSIGNFSTLRFVNLSVSTTADSLTVYVQVKLDQLEISYSGFEASVRILSVSGSFKAAVSSNLLTAQVTLKLDDDDSCEATLERLELEEFGDLDLVITGVEHVNDKFISKMAKMIVNKFTPELRPLAEDKLRELAVPYVSLACEYWA